MGYIRLKVLLKQTKQMIVAQEAQFMEKPLTQWLEILGVVGCCCRLAATRRSLSSSVPHFGSEC